MNSKDITKLMYHIRIIDRKMFKKIACNGFIDTFNDYPNEIAEVCNLLEEEDAKNIIYMLAGEVKNECSICN